jgi:hypothetical protein
LSHGRALVLVLVVAASIAGCELGPPAEPRYDPVFVAPPPDFVSGTRLRARYYVVDGIFQIFITFHDAVLDVDCTYEDEGGAHVGPLASSYCFPAGMARHREGTGPYADSACKVLAAFPPQTGAATYALVEPRDACVTAPAVYAAIAPRSEQTFLKDSTGACRRGQRSLAAGDVRARRRAGRAARGPHRCARPRW